MSAAAWATRWPGAARLGGAWRDRVDALPSRVRLLGFAVAAALLGALADMLVWEPALQTHRAVAAAEKGRAQELAALQALPPPAAASGPTARERLTAELQDLERQLARLREQAPAEPGAQAAVAPAGPAALPAVLQRTLPSPAGPALVSLAGAVPAAAASAPTVSLRLRGRYPELQQHLAEMSRRDATQPWPAWELDARQEPPVLLLQRSAGARP